MSSSSPAKEIKPGDVPALARAAVETYVLRGEQIDAPEHIAKLLSTKGACFVSIKTRSGELRGCIGTVEPTSETLASEIIMNAISAATRDPRFAPVSPPELSDLVYSVDILALPEPAEVEDLDPSVYGVIVEDEAGYRRGLLLPAIQGVETVTQQVEIAARKAGIPEGAPVKLQRFRVERFRE
ncbi:MAG TPA: AmmeMemoRadiSam system protein A [Pyrinomonadaceae bacterium]|nr:AmmeMemoRadiSam system protein A [Pyrinomonadaceae bacterium]